MAATPGEQTEVWQNMKLDFELEGINASLYGTKLELVSEFLVQLSFKEKESEISIKAC